MLLGGESFTTQIKDSVTEYFVDKAKEGLETNSPSMKTAEQIEQIPSIQGGKNQSGANQPIPLVLGESYYTPLFCGTPYVTIDPNKQDNGENEYFTALYCLGQSDIEVRDFQLGIYDIASNSENVTSGKITIDGKPYPTSTYDTELEIQNGANEVSLYSQKVVQENLNSQLLCPDGKERLIVRPFSARCPQKVRLEVMFQSLIKYSEEDGSKEETTVEIGFAYSTNGGVAYNPLKQSGKWGNSSDVKISFNRNEVYKDVNYAVYAFTATKNKMMRFALDFSLTWAQATDCLTNGNSVVEFAICRFTKDSEDTRIQDKCYFTRVTTWCFNYKESIALNNFVAQTPLQERFRNLTTRVGFKIKSGAEISGTLKEFNCIVKAKGRTYNSSTETWSTETTVTSNPASMALMVMQSPLRGKYAYKDSQIDLVSFGQLYKRADTFDNEVNGKKYTVNGVLNTQRKTSDVIQSIFNTANAYLVLKGTRYGVFVDEPQTNPIMVLNNQNVLEANNSKSFDEPTHAYKVKFVNSVNYYKQDTMLCVAKNYDYLDVADMNIVDSEFLYFTDPKRVYRKAMRLIAEKELRPEIWNRKVGIEGNLIEIGSLVELQDDTISVGIGNGAEIIEVIFDSRNNITGIRTDGDFEVTTTENRYAVKITQADGIHNPTVATYVVNITKVGDYNDFTFATPISADSNIKPCIGDIVTFGIYLKETVQALCFWKKDNGDGTFNLTFVPYSDGVYTAESGDIPTFESNVTPPHQSGMAIEDSKQNEYLDIILQNNVAGIDGLTIQTEGSSYVIPCTSDGTIEKDYVYTSKINFIQGEEDVLFEFGEIDVPNGMEIATLGRTLEFRFLQGKLLPTTGVVNIPLSYLKKVDNVPFVTPNGDYFGIGNDILGYYITKENNKFIIQVSYSKSMQGLQGIQGIQGVQGPQGIQGIQGVQGDKGDNGHRGAEYFGTTKPTDTVDGDFYLNTSDGYLYTYSEITSTWVKVSSYDDTRYITAINDMIANIKDDSTEPFKKVINQWVENLVAKSALITKLFAKTITLQPGGIIQSSDPSKGFTLKDDGTAVFNQGTFRGEVNATSGSFTGIVSAKDGSFYNINIKNSKFEGNIDSGPLYLSNDNPSMLEKFYPINTNVKSIDLFTTLSEIVTISVNSTLSYYGSNKVSKVICYYKEHLKDLYKYMEIHTNNGVFYLDAYTNSDSLKADLYLNQSNSTIKTLMLRNLPTQKPAQANVVWNDNGILKIT